VPGGVEDRGEVAGDAEDREVVAAVGLDGDLDDGLADREQVAEVHPERGPSGSTRMPAWSSPSSSSRAEASIPLDTTPRIARASIRNGPSSPGMAEPGAAWATTSPTSKLDAPQTSSISPSPPSPVTCTTRSRSASGCGPQDSTRAVRTPAVPAPG
jgi:hypothetical protein